MHQLVPSPQLLSIAQLYLELEHVLLVLFADLNPHSVLREKLSSELFWMLD